MLPLDLLCCPVTQRPLRVDGSVLSTDTGERYRIDALGIPRFAETVCSADASRQQKHYEEVAGKYVANLSYPHTEEYIAYLDGILSETLRTAELGTVAELCCGQGDVLRLLGERVGQGIGVDISPAMLAAAVRGNPGANVAFVQGDVTMLPLRAGAFDCVVMSGGIHHVRDRRKLFAEVARILRPGGQLVWREPVSDFFLWRWLRAVIYRFSSALDAETESPLTYSGTAPRLAEAGLHLEVWRPCGFLGFCFLMNSDVLVVNRWLRFLPGIRALARLAVRFDDRVTATPGLQSVGLQVVGRARKPAT